MSSMSIDLLSVDRGTVTAPAGCGKTHLIFEAVQRHTERKPVLVLTYTHAGVAALRERFRSNGVSSNSYRLSTLDGFAMRVVGTFPERSGLDSGVLKLDNPGRDYPAITKSACSLLSSGHIDDVIGSSFSRVIVDEYQDCSVDQHRFVSLMSSILPTCVLGDHLQAVFGWIGLPDWKADVCSVFPVAGELSIPWRWRNAGTEGFGQWLLHIRHKLLSRAPVDFNDSPEEVSWVDLAASENVYQCQLAAASVNPQNKNDTTLIIGNSRNTEARSSFARKLRGAVTVENVSLDDLINFARRFNCTSQGSLVDILNFASKVMRNINMQHFLKRVDSLESGRAKVQASDAEIAALEYNKNPTPASAASLLVELSRSDGVSSFRPAVLRACIRSLSACTCTDGGVFYEAAICAREQMRLLGRSLPRKAIGSTLLLKGLESDVAVVLDAADHDANSLYVAMTRGSKRLLVCSHSSTWSRY